MEDKQRECLETDFELIDKKRGLGKTDNIPIDYKDALPRFADDWDFFQDMLFEFLDELPKRVKALSLLIEYDEPESLVKVAHKFKGAAGIFSAKALCGAVGHLENIGRSGNLSRAKEAMVNMEREIDRLEEHIHEKGCLG